MSMLNLIWIVPLCVAIGYAIACMMWMASDKRGDVEVVCKKDDYIDWSKVPKGFDWVAIDPPNGACPNVVWAYYDINGPKFTNAGWRAPENTTFTPPREVCSSAIIGPLPPWRESLRKRPA